MQTKEQVGAVLGSGGTNTIGALVFWSLSGVAVRRDKFRKALEELGLDAAMSKDPSPKTALSAAVRRVMQGRAGYFARPNGREWAIVREERQTDGVQAVLAHKHVLTLTTVEAGVSGTIINPQSGEEVEVSPLESIVREVEREFDSEREYMGTAVLSEVLSAVMHGSPHRGLFAGVSLRERTGGLYFISAEHVEKMASLANLIRQEAPDCIVNVMTLTADAENLEQAAQAAKRSFENQLAELRAELVDFKAKLGADKKAPTERSIQVRANRFRELQDRVGVFREVLGSVADELVQTVEDGKSEMVKQLEALQ